MNKVILASASPRRMEILKRAGISFDVMVSNVAEDLCHGEPEHVVMQLSMRKAEAVYESINEDAVIIAADTVVASGGEIMGKPKNNEDAERMITKLQGGCHSVFTGVAIIISEGSKKKMESFAVETKVWVHDMTKDQIKKYSHSKEPIDKAGAYGIQGRFAVYIKGIEGDYYNVMGLPVSEICRRLNKMGYTMFS